MAKKTKAKKVKLDVTSELLNIQSKHGILTAEGVLKEAKKKRHPLHSHFDWEDTTAAKRWRLHQANMLISQATVTLTKHEPKTVHAFVSIKTEEGRQFVHTIDAINNKQFLFQIFSQLHSRIKAIEEQLDSLGLLKGKIAVALTIAKKPIAKQKDKLSS